MRVDERGYPIPFFVAYVDGKPNFRYQDARKRDICLAQRKCAICGKKLRKDFSYVITGPLGLQNKIVSDAPMHRVCAEFSLAACPHMYYEKAERKESGGDPHVLRNKPNLFLIKIDKYKVSRDSNNTYIHFRVVGSEEYEYIENVLTKKFPGSAAG